MKLTEDRKQKILEMIENIPQEEWDKVEKDIKQAQTKQCDIHGVSSSFKVGTYSLYKQGDSSYCHWSEGLKMVIEKDGVAIKLEGDEIKKLVGSLPRTIGGVY